MVCIKVILFGKTMPFVCFTHLSAIVYDLATNRSFLINYPFQRSRYITHEQKELQGSIYGSARRTCCMDVEYLYSAKSFDSLKKHADEKFDNSEKFNCFTNNCAGKVYALLDDAFDLSNESILYAHSVYRWFCCIGCVGTLGLLSYCFPAPPPLKNPWDEFRVAKLLSSKYGKATSAMKKLIEEREKTQAAESKEMKETKEAKDNEIVCQGEFGYPDPVTKVYKAINKIGLR